MASIQLVISKNGIHRYRVRFRRKGNPSICLSFSSKQEAEDFAFIHEQEYINNPDKYVGYEMMTRLERRREREFLKKRPICQ